MAELGCELRPSATRVHTWRSMRLPHWLLSCHVFPVVRNPYVATSPRILLLLSQCLPPFRCSVHSESMSKWESILRHCFRQKIFCWSWVKEKEVKESFLPQALWLVGILSEETSTLPDPMTQHGETGALLFIPLSKTFQRNHQLGILYLALPCPGFRQELSLQALNTPLPGSGPPGRV